MLPTKENLYRVADDLFEEGIIGGGKLFKNRYDKYEDYIICSIKTNKPENRELIIKRIENLGFKVEEETNNYIKIYWEDNEEKDLINETFNRYITTDEETEEEEEDEEEW